LTGDSGQTVSKGKTMADIDFEWLLHFEQGYGYAEYHGNDVEAHAHKLAVALNCQVDVYRMEYSFSVKTPDKSKGMLPAFRTVFVPVATRPFRHTGKKEGQAKHKKGAK
jgi:hypothetical protein